MKVVESCILNSPIKIFQKDKSSVAILSNELIRFICKKKALKIRKRDIA